KSVTVYARTANGNVAPLRTLSTPTLNGVIGLAVDNVNNELFVADYGSNPSNGSVTVYPRSANGTVAPLRTISGVVNPYDMKVDTVNNELVVVNNTNDSV